MNTINYQTLIATKSARIRDVAGENAILLELGTRRAFSPQAAMWEARAAIAAGFDSTSNVATALKLGIQLVTGTPVNGVYKLVEINGIPTMKKSPGKITYPGRKQIFRSQDNCQIYCHRLGLAEESPNSQEIPLLELVMKQGETIQQSESLTTIQQRTRLNVTKLPLSTRQITEPISFPISLSSALENLIHQV